MSQAPSQGGDPGCRVFSGSPSYHSMFQLKEALLSTWMKPQQLIVGGPSDSDQLFSLYVRTCKWGSASPSKWPGPPPGSEWRRVKTWPGC